MNDSNILFIILTFKRLFLMLYYQRMIAKIPIPKSTKSAN